MRSFMSINKPSDRDNSLQPSTVSGMTYVTQSAIERMGTIVILISDFTGPKPSVSKGFQCLYTSNLH